MGLDLASSLARRGVMPHLGRLLERGAAWATRSPLPEVSPVCWTSMFSGRGPGGHGIYGFAAPVAGSYRITPCDSTMVRAPRIWELAGRAGLTSVVLNVPLTYPAAPLRGSMVSGFVTIDLAKGVHPPALLPRLQAMGYRPEAELDTGRSDPAALLADVAQALAVRLELFEQTWEDSWDLWVGVIGDTDRVNHFAWPALWEPEHPLAPAALKIYRQVDEHVGRLWRRFGPQVEAGRGLFDDRGGPLLRPHRQRGVPQPVADIRRLSGGGGRTAPRAHPARNQGPGPGPGAHLSAPGGPVPRRQHNPRPGGGAPVATDRGQAHGPALFPADPGAGRPPFGEPDPRWPGCIWAGSFITGRRQATPRTWWPEPAHGYSLRGGLDRAGVFGLSHLTGTHRPQGGMALMLPEPGDKPVALEGLFGLMAGALGIEPAA